MPTVALAPTVGVLAQLFTTGGLPLNAGLLYTYAAGGTTPLATYTTSAGNVQNANPIVLGADGRPPNEVWLIADSAYRFDLKTSAGTLIASYDNIGGIVTSPGLNGPITATAFIPNGSTVPTNGMYLPSANTLGFATNSTLSLSVSETSIAKFGAANQFSLVAATGPAATAFLIANSGDGTTSSRTSVFQAISNETSPQSWSAGLFGTKSWDVHNDTGSITALSISTAGLVTFPQQSGTFTATGTGFTVDPTATASWSVCNGVASVFYPALTGTSDDTTFTITGAPAAIQPVTGKPGFSVGVQDNSGSTTVGRADIGTNGVVTLYLAMATTPFTNSGTKSFVGFNFTYKLT